MCESYLPNVTNSTSHLPQVNEEGTEAAAATALISFRIARPVGPEEFICNHPFLFVIYDNDTKNVLFMGAYKNPNA